MSESIKLFNRINEIDESEGGNELNSIKKCLDNHYEILKSSSSTDEYNRNGKRVHLTSLITHISISENGELAVTAEAAVDDGNESKRLIPISTAFFKGKNALAEAIMICASNAMNRTSYLLHDLFALDNATNNARGPSN